VPHILAPADGAREVGPLAGAGADALYFGYLPGGGEMGRETFNRRTFPEAQVATADEARALIGEAAGHGLPVWVTFNASFYPPDRYGPVLGAAREMAAAGAAGFIVADIALLILLRREGLGSLSLSTLAGVHNGEAARFFGDLGAERITLPRELSTPEIIAIATANPGLVFDVFVLFGACPNAESACRWPHDDPDRIWPCVRRYAPSGAPSELVRGAMEARLGWCGLRRSEACGLCSLADLSGVSNIGGLKIVGRGAPLERKLRGVRALREVADAAAAGAGRGEILALAREVNRRLTGHDCIPRLCYYPEYR
jgi:putative protease